jgi:hypothetical protein
MRLMRTRWLAPAGILALFVLLAFTWSGCERTSEMTTGPAPAMAGQPGGPFTMDNPLVRSAAEIQNAHTPELMAIPDVVGTGTGLGSDGRPAILVLTRSRSFIPAVPEAIEGVPTRIEVVGDVQALASYKGTYRPVPGGVSVGNDRECAAGTIGCIVLKGGTRYILSNNHVLARVNAASIGERIDQPGRYDAKPACGQTGQIATLSDFVRISFSGNNTVDCALAQLTTTSVCSMVNNLYTPGTTTVSPSVGLAVKKVGRTSGLTHGTIAGINVSYGSPGVATFVNQIYVASSFIRSGDSGSLMVTESGANPVGLCFAGGTHSSFANPIGPVLQALACTVCGN